MASFLPFKIYSERQTRKRKAESWIDSRLENPVWSSSLALPHPASYLCSPPGYLFLLLGSLSQPSPPFPLRCLQCHIFLQQLHQQSSIIFSPRDSGCLSIILIYSSELWFSISSQLNLRPFFTEMKKKKKWPNEIT